ncbi:hypothetical protein HK098_008283 [Nowakowskiella sp. JEL0407]|nr:hypothetical protein HK098_008283 [Nowakowskiella sp. JEL0407]
MILKTKIGISLFCRATLSNSFRNYSRLSLASNTSLYRRPTFQKEFLLAFKLHNESESLRWRSIRTFHSTRVTGYTFVASGAIVLLLRASRLLLTSKTLSVLKGFNFLTSCLAAPLFWRYHFFRDYPKTMYTIIISPLALLVVALIASQDYHPITGRRRWIFFDEESSEEALQMNKLELESVFREFEGKFLDVDHPGISFSRILHHLPVLKHQIFTDYQRVFHVAENIVSLMPSVRPWELYVISSPLRNAFVLPSGQIFIFTGLLNSFSSPHLAAIISHEVSHVLSRHKSESQAFQMFIMFIGDVVHSVLYTFSVNLPLLTDFFGRGVESGKKVLGELPYSRMCEAEADLIGIFLMSLAGYDPKHGVEVWDIFGQSESEKMESDAGSDVFSDHPSHSHRAIELSRCLPAARKVYERRGELCALLNSTELLPDETELDRVNRVLKEILGEYLEEIGGMKAYEAEIDESGWSNEKNEAMFLLGIE